MCNSLGMDATTKILHSLPAAAAFYLAAALFAPAPSLLRTAPPAAAQEIAHTSAAR